MILITKIVAFIIINAKYLSSHAEFNGGLLYPRESESREVKSLDGLWDFRIPPDGNITINDAKAWISNDLSREEVISMPVPSSYNDITMSAKLRDYVGEVWYARNFFIPEAWKKKRVFIRFGSVNYYAQVWVNEVKVMEHEVGHLPFESEISDHLKFGGKNRITVAVDNKLSNRSVPQGKVNEIKIGNKTILRQSYAFDFFNYAGIHRSVLLHTKPTVYIDDIIVEISSASKNIKYKRHPPRIVMIKHEIKVAGFNSSDNLNYTLTFRDKSGALVTTNSSYKLSGKMPITSMELWWPRGMSPNPGYMYTMEVSISDINSTIFDIYRLPIGIRTLRWDDKSLLINNIPIYLKGFGRHEDSLLRGRGFDPVTMTKDHELLKWIGANAYRTSHYPYSDEVMDMADKQGFLIIDECPSVNTIPNSEDMLSLHKRSLAELIRRDKNRPSVIMWSIANEGRTLDQDGWYYNSVALNVKKFDSSRPITSALSSGVSSDGVGKYLDIICFNRYHGWYTNPGQLYNITDNIIAEANAWHNKYNKPVFMCEYGADTLSGLHELPEYTWSEEYQAALVNEHFDAFDKLRKEGWFIGELLWNFADFRTDQMPTRVAGNKKGVFTRDRQPKLAAYAIRRRYNII